MQLLQMSACNELHSAGLGTGKMCSPSSQSHSYFEHS